MIASTFFFIIRPWLIAQSVVGAAAISVLQNGSLVMTLESDLADAQTLEQALQFDPPKALFSSQQTLSRKFSARRIVAHDLCAPKILASFDVLRRPDFRNSQVAYREDPCEEFP